MISCILCFIPEPSATMEATEVMPMMMPNIVRKVRRRCARSALAAILMASVKRAKHADARRAVCGGAFSWGLEHFSVIFPVSLRSRRLMHTVFALAPWANRLKNALGNDHGHDVLFAHHQQFLAIHFNGLARILSKQHHIVHIHI